MSKNGALFTNFSTLCISKLSGISASSRSKKFSSSPVLHYREIISAAFLLSSPFSLYSSAFGFLSMGLPEVSSSKTLQPASAALLSSSSELNKSSMSRNWRPSTVIGHTDEKDQHSSFQIKNYYTINKHPYVQSIYAQLEANNSKRFSKLSLLLKGKGSRPSTKVRNEYSQDYFQAADNFPSSSKKLSSGWDS